MFDIILCFDYNFTLRMCILIEQMNLFLYMFIFD